MNIILIFIALFSGINSPETPELTVNISNIKNLKGEVNIGVFNSEVDYLKEGKAIKYYSIKVTQATEILVIKDLPKGEYAISLYHDENSDNKCNRNFLGIPKEGYGFSNNIKPKLSAPSYKDCKFLLTENKVLNIALIN